MAPRTTGTGSSGGAVKRTTVPVVTPVPFEATATGWPLSLFCVPSWGSEPFHGRR